MINQDWYSLENLALTDMQYIDGLIEINPLLRCKCRGKTIICNIKKA